MKTCTGDTVYNYVQSFLVQMRIFSRRSMKNHHKGRRRRRGSDCARSHNTPPPHLHRITLLSKVLVGYPSTCHREHGQREHPLNQPGSKNPVEVQSVIGPHSPRHPRTESAPLESRTRCNPRCERLALNRDGEPSRAQLSPEN